MVDVVRPRTDRVEVGEDIPDGVRVGRDAAAAVNVGTASRYAARSLALGRSGPVAEFATFHRSGACTWQTSLISR